LRRMLRIVVEHRDAGAAVPGGPIPAQAVRA
jgi:hypothetical protein